jgi:uncharacterized protein (DUF433 family)
LIKARLAQFSILIEALYVLPLENNFGAVMQTQQPSLYTPTEAAVLTRLPLKAVNNAIDKKTVPTVIGERAGHSMRLFDLRGLMSLTLERRLADRFVPELRRELFAALAGASRKMVSLDGGFLKVDLRELWRELAISLRGLRRARLLVIGDPDIKGGEPIFRGTRVQVHLIASLIARGESEDDILASYPRINAEMIRLAPVYAAAYPLRGRPRKQPWHDHPPVSRSVVKLSTIEIA